MVSTVYYGSPQQAQFKVEETLPAKLDLILEKLKIRAWVRNTKLLNMALRWDLAAGNTNWKMFTPSRKMPSGQWDTSRQNSDQTLVELRISGVIDQRSPMNSF